MNGVDLVVRSGYDAGKRIEVSDEVLIGRGEATDLTLDDPQVSRRHAVVRRLGPGAEVEDLGSTNGTYLNDHPVEEPTPFGPGDELRVGETTLEIETDLRAAETVAGAAAPAAASTEPIRIDSSNVPRWEPPAAQRRPRRSTAELSFGRSGELLRRLPAGAWRWIALGVLVVVILVLAVVLLGGGAVSKKDFVAAADRACHRSSVAARGSDPGHARSPGALRRTTRRLARVRTRGLHHLRALDQPESAPKLRRFYRRARGTTREVRALGAAAKAKPSRRRHAIAGARGRLRRAVRAERKAAHAYGFKTCGRLLGV